MKCVNIYSNSNLNNHQLNQYHPMNTLLTLTPANNNKNKEKNPFPLKKMHNISKFQICCLKKKMVGKFGAALITAGALCWATKPEQDSFSSWFNKWIQRKQAQQLGSSSSSWMTTALTRLTSSFAQIISQVEFRDYGIARIAIVSFSDDDKEEDKFVFIGALNTWYEFPRYLITIDASGKKK
jgi:hypothetical protein